MNTRKAVGIAKKITNSDLLKALPGVGLVVSASHDLLSISDKILYKKCKRFFDSLNDNLSDEDKLNLITQFDETYRMNEDKQEFGDRLLEYMNSMNDSYKAVLAAKIFRYWMIGDKDNVSSSRKITENDFYHVVEMMNNIPVDVLKAIENKYSMDSFQVVNDKYSLVQYGVYTLKVDTRTISAGLGRSMNGMSTASDDLIKKTFYGEVLEAAIWNRKMPGESEENK